MSSLIQAKSRHVGLQNIADSIVYAGNDRTIASCTIAHGGAEVIETMQIACAQPQGRCLNNFPPFSHVLRSAEVWLMFNIFMNSRR